MCAANRLVEERCLALMECQPGGEFADSATEPVAAAPHTPAPQPTQNKHPIPAQVTHFYLEHMRRSGYYHQLRRIVEPSEQELTAPGWWDTSGEHACTVITGLQHKFPQTALILVADACFSYCRFCFRSRFVGRSSHEIAVDYPKIAEYIRQRPQINNVLLSGGDPLMLDTERLNDILDHLLPIPHLSTIRIGTRAIVYYPARFNDEQLGLMFERILQAGKTAVLVTHINHFAEVSNEAERHLSNLRKLGVLLYNQTVLLKDVNDDPAILASTFRELHALGVRPYYLFQARPVKGASHFQVPLRRGVEIVHSVNRLLSGIEKTFRYIVSHSTGKIEILDVGEDNRLYMRYHQHTDGPKIGRIFSRPCPEETSWLDDLPE
ncbi:MAG TPA: KamA family radical SAM protein [Sedimentisphaerales bacterium]|nr:KamA family radical SAM protein [Sedimentisphaerales bacterium]